MSDPAPLPRMRPPAGQNFIGAHHRYGAPVETYCYEDSEGPLFYVCRYDGEGPDNERLITWTWSTGSRDFTPLNPLKPRPLYRLEQLELKPEAPVLLVGDERIADAAQRLMRETIVGTWHGGMSHLRSADWTPLAGRVVNLWPTAEETGWEGASQIAGWLLGLGCTVGIVDTHGQPAGWSLADAIQEGWKLEDILRYARDRKRPITRPQPSLKVSTPITSLQTGNEGQKNRLQTGFQDELPPEETPPPPEEEATSFHALYRQYDLALDGNSRPHINVDNVIRIISKHPGTWANVWYDEFLQKIMSQVSGEPREWSDVDTLKLMLWFQRSMGFAKIGAETVHAAVSLYAHGRPRNEAREWLRALVWDDVERLPELMSKGFGGRSDEYSSAVGRCFVMGMAQRILKPGCKLDNLPVFEGAEGTFKSTALSILGGSYYTETHERIGDKDFYLVFPGKMLIEISELNSFSRVEVERVKGVVSTAVDRYRAPYARSAADHPRMSAFAATTNSDDWNVSDTGARRMWPVACGKVDVAWLRDVREQLFAEAVARLDRGEIWYDVPVDQARKEQGLRHVGDLFEEALGYYLNSRDQCTIPDCLGVLGIEDKDKWTPKNQARVASILRRNGFIQTRAQIGKVQTRVWRRRLAPQTETLPPDPKPLGSDPLDF